ncbi:hypothetical protein QAD02_005231, partial [Eretmocerus hayati]
VLFITYFSVIAIVSYAAEIVPEDDWSPTTESYTVEDVTNQIPNDEIEGILESPTRQRRTIDHIVDKVVEAVLKRPEVVDAVYGRVLHLAHNGSLANLIRPLTRVAYQEVRANMLGDVQEKVLPGMDRFFRKMIGHHRNGEGQSSRAERIRNGLVLDAAYPWIVAIHSSYNPTQGQCAGSVIGPKLVLTTIQCLYKGGQRNDNDHVRALSSDGQSEISHYFANIFAYNSNIDPVTLVPDHDIAVIVLSKEIQNIQPISLPPMDLKVPPGIYAQAFGWGSSDHDAISWNLRNSFVKTMPCYSDSQNDWSKPYICIGASISPTCPGDSGGPLIYENFLVGIVSNKVQPCGTGAVVFTKVISYVKWIERLTSERV